MTGVGEAGPPTPPLWMAVGWEASAPFEERSGAMTFTNWTIAGAEKIVPLFTSADLVQRFIAEVGGDALVAELVDTPRKLVGVLDWLQARQYTHVVFDPVPTTREVHPIPIAEVIEAVHKQHGR